MIDCNAKLSYIDIYILSSNTLWLSCLLLLLQYKLIILHIFDNPGRMGNTPCRTELTKEDIQFLQKTIELDEAALKVKISFKDNLTMHIVYA